jgi:predicted ester cyclase
LVLHVTALQDVIWMSNKRVVGKKAFSSFVQQMREAYPDLQYEVDQVR